MPAVDVKAGPRTLACVAGRRGRRVSRAIPCNFIGKHLRFSDDDIAQIMAEDARQPVTHARGIRR
jgi:hypothetical protein